MIVLNIFHLLRPKTLTLESIQPGKASTARFVRFEVAWLEEKGKKLLSLTITGITSLTNEGWKACYLIGITE